jgi:hypothetical protein
LCTPEELRRRLVNATGLNHPPVSLSISTLQALRRHFRHGAELTLFLPYYYDFFFSLIFTADDTGLLQRLFPPTFWANVATLNVICVAESPALWTKFQLYNLRETYPYKSSF